MLKRSYFKQKPRKPLKRTSLKRGTSQLKRTRLNVAGHSTTAQDREEIQRLVRVIVTMRDGGCVLRKHRCGVEAYVQDEIVISDSIIQADHLVTRSNSASYADTRLIVCLCGPCHSWKHWHEKEYDALVRSILPVERLKLWDRVEEARQAHQTHKADWKLEITALKQEYAKILKEN